MNRRLMMAAITVLATFAATGCVSQQDKGTMEQWREFREHVFAETSPATTDTPAQKEEQKEVEHQEAVEVPSESWDHDDSAAHP